MKYDCIIICPANDDRDTEWCLLTRTIYPSVEAAQQRIDDELKAFPGGRAKGAKVVECYFGTNFRRLT